jgi:small conductance mechanosensitive channel
VPNAKAFSDVIINFSRNDSRLIELSFEIDYADDLDRALALMIESAKADTCVLADPAPWAKLTALGDSAMKVTLRAWVRPKDWSEVRFDLTRAARDALLRGGIHFAYPHQVGLTREEAVSGRPRANRAAPPSSRRERSPPSRFSPRGAARDHDA